MANRKVLRGNSYVLSPSGYRLASADSETCCCGECEGCTTDQCAFTSGVEQPATIEWGALGGFDAGVSDAGCFDTTFYRASYGFGGGPITFCDPGGHLATNSIGEFPLSDAMTTDLATPARSFTYVPGDYTLTYDAIDGDCTPTATNFAITPARITSCVADACEVYGSIPGAIPFQRWEHTWTWAESITAPAGAAVYSYGSPTKTIETTITDAFAVMDISTACCMFCDEELGTCCRFDGSRGGRPRAGYRKIATTAIVIYYGLAEVYSSYYDDIVFRGIVELGAHTLTHVPTFVENTPPDHTCSDTPDPCRCDEFDELYYAGANVGPWWLGGCAINQQTAIPLVVRDYSVENEAPGGDALYVCRSHGWNCVPPGTMRSSTGYGPSQAKLTYG